MDSRNHHGAPVLARDLLYCLPMTTLLRTRTLPGSSSYPPDSTRWRNARGMELEAEGKIDEAIELYERDVVEGCPTAHPYDRLRTIYEHRNELASAIRVCQAAVQAFSENPRKAQRFGDTTARLRKRAAWAMMQRGMGAEW